MTAETVIYGAAAKDAPWYIVLSLVAFPGMLAVLLTMVASIMVRRVNRDDGNLPLSAWIMVKWTLGVGAIFGPLCQFGFQRLVGALTGIEIYWELVIVWDLYT